MFVIENLQGNAIRGCVVYLLHHVFGVRQTGSGGGCIDDPFG
jgi:hypothetical protein